MGNYHAEYIKSSAVDCRDLIKSMLSGMKLEKKILK